MSEYQPPTCSCVGIFMHIYLYIQVGWTGNAWLSIKPKNSRFQ